MLIFEDLKRFSHPLIFKNNDVVETDGKDGHSLRTADAFPVVSEGEKRRPEMRLLFAG